MRPQAEIEALSDEEELALRASEQPLRRGLLVVIAVAVLCGAFATALVFTGESKLDYFLLAVSVMCTVVGSKEARRMRRQVRSITATLATGQKEVHKTKVQAVSFRGGTTNPRYYLTLEGLGRLRYQPVRGLPMVGPATLNEGQNVEVHLAGEAPLFLRLTPNHSIEGTANRLRRSPAPHVKR